MSARDELYALAVCGDDRTADAAIDAYRAEVLREAGGVAVDLIAAVPHRDPDGLAKVDAYRAYSDRLHEIADGGTPVAPGFFQPGHGYTHLDGHDFLCVAVTTHPRTGWLYAMGWISERGQMHRPAVRDINHWRHEYDGCQPPAEGEAPRG